MKTGREPRLPEGKDRKRSGTMKAGKRTGAFPRRRTENDPVPCKQVREPRLSEGEDRERAGGTVHAALLRGIAAT